MEFLKIYSDIYLYALVKGLVNQPLAIMRFPAKNVYFVSKMNQS